MTDSKLSLEIQLAHGDIGTLIGSKLSDAINAELEKLDVGKMIVEKLTAPRSEMPGFAFVYASRHGLHANLLDELISNAIRAEAKAFVDRHLAENRDALEHRFVEMMRGSEKKITQSFCKAMLGAVDSGDWRFDLEAKVSVPERGDADRP